MNKDKLLNCGFVADKFAHVKMENISSMNTCQLIKLLNRLYVIVTKMKALALNTREQCNFTYLHYTTAMSLIT